MVVARNAVGTSAPSSESTPVGMPAVPDAPTIVTASAVVGSITITYTLGADNGAPITGVKATCTSSNGGTTRASKLTLAEPGRRVGADGWQDLQLRRHRQEHGWRQHHLCRVPTGSDGRCSGRTDDHPCRRPRGQDRTVHHSRCRQRRRDHWIPSHLHLQRWRSDQEEHTLAGPFHHRDPRYRREDLLVHRHRQRHGGRRAARRRHRTPSSSPQRSRRPRSPT